MGIFTDKVAVITGAGSGIGRALALQLAGKGARLALSDVDARGLQETIKALPVVTEARGYALDVADRNAVLAHAGDVERDFGTAHFVVNNAGATMIGTIEHLTVEEIEWQLGVNLWGVIYGTKAFLPMMLAQNEGAIVNISSVFGLVGYPAQGAYNISKFGVRGLTECLWSELEGTGVRAVCAASGRHQDQYRKVRSALRRLRRRGGKVLHARRQAAADDGRRLCGRDHFRPRARPQAHRYGSPVLDAALAEPAVAQRLSGRASGRRGLGARRAPALPPAARSRSEPYLRCRHRHDRVWPPPGA